MCACVCARVRLQCWWSLLMISAFDVITHTLFDWLVSSVCALTHTPLLPPRTHARTQTTTTLFFPPYSRTNNTIHLQRQVHKRVTPHHHAPSSNTHAHRTVRSGTCGRARQQFDIHLSALAFSQRSWITAAAAAWWHLYLFFGNLSSHPSAGAGKRFKYMGCTKGTSARGVGKRKKNKIRLRKNTSEHLSSGENVSSLSESRCFITPQSHIGCYLRAFCVVFKRKSQSLLIF